MKRLRQAVCLLIVAVLALGLAEGAAALTKEETIAAFEAAALALQTPARQGMETGTYALHPGESAFVPDVAPDITPFDAELAAAKPVAEGSFESSDEQVVTVDARGLMTAVSQGNAAITYHKAAGDVTYQVTVSESTPTELAKSMAYVALQEFYNTKRAKLPKYNKYAKWYYGKKNEVGWCSVFGIWCANAAGNNPIKEKEAAEIPEEATLYLREGQVGNQYDGFLALDRFSGVPAVGYMVIYADMSNAYRTTHIGVVVDVQDRGGGLYQVTTVEGNMSNSVKGYRYLYDSNADNHLVGVEKGLKLKNNMSQLPPEEQTDPLFQYELHTDHWSVFGFCQTWK